MLARGAGAINLRWFSDVWGRAAARWRRGPLARLDGYDLAAVLLFGTLIVLVGLTFRDYAISNDEEVQQRYGEMIVAYYTSGFVDQALFHFRNLYLYGGLFDLAAVGLEKLIPLDTYEVRHLLTALTGIGGIAAIWATARAIAGPRAGLLAAAALAVCGTWYGAMFNHTKDIPFAAAMMGGLYLLVLIGRELPRPRWHLIVLFGLVCGCALGIRVLGVFLVSYAALAVALHAPIGRGVPWRKTVAFGARSAVPLAAAFVIGYLIMIAAWPYAALAPLNPLRAMTAFVDFDYPIQTMLAGHVYQMGDVPRWYVPTYHGDQAHAVAARSAPALALVLRRRCRNAPARPTDNALAKRNRAGGLCRIFPADLRSDRRRAGVHRDPPLFLHRAADCGARRYRPQRLALPARKSASAGGGGRSRGDRVWPRLECRSRSIACIRTSICSTIRWSAASPAPRAIMSPITGST